MSQPRLLLLDEPSMGLAPLLVKEIFSIIKEINASGTTILLVEQNANMALSIAHQAYVLETGRIILSGPAKELAESEEVRKAYLGG
jgi:branched-chain amino acid transport system ATP-binding protein